MGDQVPRQQEPPPGPTFVTRRRTRSRHQRRPRQATGLPSPTLVLCLQGTDDNDFACVVASIRFVGSRCIGWWMRKKCVQVVFGMVRMAWHGMVWYDMIWNGMVWYVMIWYGMVWYGMVSYGMVWYMLWYGAAWHGMVWYGPGGVLTIFLGGGVPPGPENPYPISDQTIRFSVPYFRPDSKCIPYFRPCDVW